MAALAGATRTDKRPKELTTLDRDGAPTRLGPTDYEWPGVERSRLAAQQRFLEAVRKEAPQVLESLGKEPLDLLTGPGIHERSRTPPTWQALLKAAENGDSDLASLRDALLTWSRRWNLEADWCRDQALRTLYMWAGVPPSDPSRSAWSHKHGSLFQPFLSSTLALQAT
jgi:hypothetical protein